MVISWGGVIINLTLAFVLVFFVAMVISNFMSLIACENNESSFCPPSLCAGMHYNPQMIVYDYNQEDASNSMVSPLDLCCENNDCSNGMPTSSSTVVIPATVLDPVNIKIYGSLFTNVLDVSESVFGNVNLDQVKDLIQNGPGAYQCRYTYPSFLVKNECLKKLRTTITHLNKSSVFINTDIDGNVILNGVNKPILEGVRDCYTNNTDPWQDVCNWRLYGVRDQYVISDGDSVGSPCNFDNINISGDTECTLTYGLPGNANFDPTDQLSRLEYSRKSIESNWTSLSLATGSVGQPLQGIYNLLKVRIDRVDLTPLGFDMTVTPQELGFPQITYQNVENFFNTQDFKDVEPQALLESMYMCSLTDQGVSVVQSEQMYAMRLIGGTTDTPGNVQGTTGSEIGFQMVPGVACAMHS